MGYKLVIEVKDCRDCPCRHTERDMGSSWEACEHPDSPKAYGNYLWGCQERFKKIPDWCPLIK